MRARRNEVMTTLYNMVDNNPNASMWRTSDTRPDQADLKRTGEGVVALKIDGKDKYVILKKAKQKAQEGKIVLHDIDFKIRLGDSFVDRGLTDPSKL